MGRRTLICLKNIQGNRKISKEMDPEFLFELENALLLALKELSVLWDIQYSSVENAHRKLWRRPRR